LSGKGQEGVGVGVGRGAGVAVGAGVGVGDGFDLSGLCALPFATINKPSTAAVKIGTRRFFRVRGLIVSELDPLNNDRKPMMHDCETKTSYSACIATLGVAAKPLCSDRAQQIARLGFT